MGGKGLFFNPAIGSLRDFFAQNQTFINSSVIGFVSLRLAYHDVLLGVPLGRILQDQVKAEFWMSSFHNQHQELDGQQRQQLTLARERMNQSMAIVTLLAERTGLDMDRKTINLSIGRKVLQTRVDFLQEAAEAIEGSKVRHTRSKRFANKLRSSFKGIRKKISDTLKKRQAWRNSKNSKNSKKTDGPDNKKTEGVEKSKPENDKPEELGKKKKSRLSSAAKAAVKTGAAVGLVAALDTPNFDTPDFDLLDFADLPGGGEGHHLLDFDDLPAGHDEEGDEYDYEGDDEEEDEYDYDGDGKKGDDYEDDYGKDVQQTLNMFTISAVSVSKETTRLYTAIQMQTPNCFFFFYQESYREVAELCVKVLGPVLEGSTVTLASLNIDTFNAQLKEASRKAGERGLVSCIPYFFSWFFHVNCHMLFLPKELVTEDAERLLQISDYTHRTDDSLAMVFVQLRMPLRAINGDLAVQRYCTLQ